MLFGGFTVHFQPVGAVQILKKRIIQYGNDCSMLTTHRQIVDDDVIVRLAPDGDSLFVEGVFFYDPPIHAEYQFCSHSLNPRNKLFFKPI